MDPLARLLTYCRKSVIRTSVIRTGQLSGHEHFISSTYDTPLH